MSARPKTVKDFDPNSQDPDEPWDTSSDWNAPDGMKIRGKGAQGGGSAPTPQVQSTRGNRTARPGRSVSGPIKTSKG